MSIANQVIEIIAQQAFVEVDTVTVASRLDDLGIDSMGIVECIFAIEETFDVNVPFNANTPTATDFNISTVGSIITGVERLMREQV